MSIFRRDSEPAPPTPSMPASPAAPKKPAPRPSTPPAASSAPTHIASGIRVVGQITGDAELVIDGQVDGEIDLDSRVVVGASGRVEGEIQARAIEVGGKVQGNVRGRERVEVLATGGLEGDVVSPRVVIAEGAFFKGKVEMADPTRKGKAQSSGAQSSSTQPSSTQPSRGQARKPQASTDPRSGGPGQQQGVESSKTSKMAAAGEAR